MKPNSPVSFDQYQQLISCIYDAALDESQWENALNTLANILHADKGSIRILNMHSKDIQQVHTLNIDPSFSQSYIDHYMNIDPWIEILLKARDTMFDCTHHLLTNKEYESLEYHQDFVAPQGHYYGVGGTININNDTTCYISFQRAKKHQGFEAYYLDLLYKLAPHIQKAVLLNKKICNLELEKNTFSDSMNQINCPLMLVNKNGTVLFINSQAEQIMDLQTDMIIRNNYIIIRSLEDDKLQKLIHHATHGQVKQGGAMCYTDSTTQDFVSILVSPVNPDRINIDTHSDDNALLVLSTKQQQKPLPTEMLCNLYNITKAEARLTMHLCQGLTLDEISEKLSLSKNTLRSQLRSCFRKTGTSRQAELVSLISNGPTSIIAAI